MQQRQLRLGDTLDDYCPRERRLTNHVVVAMVGDDVKQTRCTTCDADHEYKHAAVPRQRRKPEQSALYSQVLANVTPKRVVANSESAVTPVDAPQPETREVAYAAAPAPAEPPASAADAFNMLFDAGDEDDADGNRAETTEEGFAHRRLIR